MPSVHMMFEVNLYSGLACVKSSFSLHSAFWPIMLTFKENHGVDLWKS